MSEQMQKTCISIVPIFNHLTAEEMQEIVKTTKSATYPRGNTIYSAGESSEGLYIVHKGRVKIYRLSESGKNSSSVFLNLATLPENSLYFPLPYMMPTQKRWLVLNFV